MSPFTTQPGQVKAILLWKQNQETNWNEETSRGDPSLDYHVLAYILILQRLLQSQSILQKSHRNKLRQFSLTSLHKRKVELEANYPHIPSHSAQCLFPPNLYNSMLTSTRSYIPQKASWAKSKESYLHLYFSHLPPNTSGLLKWTLKTGFPTSSTEVKHELIKRL